MELAVEIAEKVKSEDNLIGEGTGRKVYSLNSDLVVKVAKNKAGIEQNKVEYNAKGKYFAKTYAAADDYTWITMEIVNECDEEHFNLMTNCNNGERVAYLDYIYFEGQVLNKEFPLSEVELDYHKKASDRVNDEFLNKALDNEFLMVTGTLMKKYGLEGGDLSRFGSWGTNLDGQLVLFDYGLDRKTWKTYYKREVSDIIIDGVKCMQIKAQVIE